MKKKVICIIILGILIIAGVAIMYFLKPKKSMKPEYMPCPVLAEGETRDVVIPESMYYGSTASAMARHSKKEGRCIDAWVTDYGVLMVRHNQDTLEKEYESYFNSLMKDIDYEDPTLKMEVTYDYSEVTLYVRDDTSLDDLGFAIITVPGKCYMLRLLQGIPSYENKVDVVVVYESTGKEILRLERPADELVLYGDEWEKLLEYGRQGE